MKTCKKCNVEKEETEFFRKKEKWLEGKCKQCKKSELQNRIALNPEEYAKKERERSEKRRKTEEYKEWRKDHQRRNREVLTRKALDDYHCKNRLEKQKIWKANNREKINLYSRLEKKKRPFKHAARVFVRAAIVEGILVRPLLCSKCNKECKAEAHHENYMEPLKIVWLCRSCHAWEHRKMK